MKKHLTLLYFLLISQLSFAQLWTWAERNPMPEAVANNAITSATVDGVPYVYSFAGINDSKIWSGIHLRSFRYNTQSDIWETIPSLPDVAGKERIAAGASTVRNKIYIIGGYHVQSNDNEISIDKVHIFDPESNTYLPDGAAIPIPIDDQVQAVWQDSLIYVITGWSNTRNVADVQIYHPNTDNWTAGTPVPNADYEVFGASGVIIGDTIYYAGGATFGSNFPLGSFFRKGYIHPTKPDSITWSSVQNPLALGYRMGAITTGSRAAWIGGSAISYNYDGIAYNGSGGVPALDRIVLYEPATGELSATEGAILPVMDLRGIAQISENEYIIAGGMRENQTVTDRVFLLTNLDFLSVKEPIQQPNIRLYPNPTQHALNIAFNNSSPLPYHFQLFDLQGSKIIEKLSLLEKNITLPTLPMGCYLAKIQQGKSIFWEKVFLVD